LLYFIFACIILSKIIFLYSCFYLLAFSFARMGTPENTKLCDFTSTKNNDFIYTPIAPPAPEANFYEIKPALLNLVMKEQFSGASSDDATAHLNNFVELCEMQKYKDVDGNIIKLRDFYFRAPGSLVVLSFPQPLNFSIVLSKPLSKTVTSAGTAGCLTVVKGFAA
jgi:hypothetical protein